MKSSLVLAPLCALLLLHDTRAYRTDITEEGEVAFCEYRKHLTFKPTATCCANKVIKPGLDITQFWGQCVQEVAGKSDTVEGIGWNIYSCILRAASGKDRLSLQEFADLITSNYPDDIKSKINEEIQSQSIPAASLDNYGRLEKLRVTYYDIEKEVCEGMPSETKSYGQIEMCSSWKEENHRAGMCCSNSYPVDIRYKSLFDAGDTQIMDRCREKMHDGLTKLNVSEMMENTVLDICDVACTMDFMHNLDINQFIIEKDDYRGFSASEQLEKLPLVPHFLSPSTREEVKSYLASVFVINDTIKAIQNYEFADVVGGDSNHPRSSHNIAWVHRGNKTIGENFKYQFMGRRFHKGMLHVPVLCSAYRELVTRAEHYIFQKCKPEDVTETPAPAEETKSEPEAPAEPADSATEAAAK